MTNHTRAATTSTEATRATPLVDLGLTALGDSNAGTCGCGGCGCGSANGEGAEPNTAGAGMSSAAGGIRTVIGVEGMTCDHCVMSVTEELSDLPGVTNVSVQLAPGAVSAVTVTSDRAIERDALSTAVSEAGYSLAPLS